MEQNNPQLREHFTSNCVKMREGEGDEGRIIEGDAVVFNTPTTLYEDDEICIREVILPSCVTPDFLAQQDIKLNLLHNRGESFCRNNKGVGTLNLQLREDALAFDTTAPHCDFGDRAVALIGNKTYTGCSFEFYEGDYDREQTTLADGKIDVLYTHKTFTSISALTIAMDPAYPTTKIGTREKEIMKREKDALAEAEKAKALAEAEQKAQQEREAKEKAAAKRERINALRTKADKIFA